MQLRAALWWPLFAGVGALQLLASREDGFLARAAIGNAVYVATLDNHYMGQQYTCNISVAGEEMPVIPDTGSFSLLVTSTRCEECPQKAFDYEAAEEEGMYDPSPEKTVNELITFGSGAVKVRKGYADVDLGGSMVRTALWEITESDHSMNQVWKGAAFEGIFGLGWKDTDRNETTVLHALEINQFTFCFGTGSKTGGALYFNTLLPDRAQVFAPVIGHQHWGVALSKFTVGRQGAPVVCADSPCGALIDSGTSQLLLPPAHVAAFKEMIGPVDPDCTNYDQLPELVFSLGGNELRLPKETYSRRIVMGGIPKIVADGPKLTFEATEKKEYCWLTVGSVLIQSDKGPVWILGMPFFRNHLVSFDRAERRIGFGKPCGPGNAPDPVSYAEELCKTGDLVDEDGNTVPCQDLHQNSTHVLLRTRQAPNDVARATAISPGLGQSRF